MILKKDTTRTLILKLVLKISAVVSLMILDYYLFYF